MSSKLLVAPLHLPALKTDNKAKLDNLLSVLQIDERKFWDKYIRIIFACVNDNMDDLGELLDCDQSYLCSEYVSQIFELVPDELNNSHYDDYQGELYDFCADMFIYKLRDIAKQIAC